MKKKLTMESNFTLIFMWKKVTFRSFLSLRTNSQSPTSRLPVDFYLLFRPDERQQSTLTHSPNTHFTSITLSSLINEHRFYPIWLLLWIKLCTVSLCIASQSRVPFSSHFSFFKAQSALSPFPPNIQLCHHHRDPLFPTVSLSRWILFSLPCERWRPSCGAT